jgi:hypothetical protein
VTAGVLRQEAGLMFSITVDLKEVSLDGTEWIDLAQGRGRWRSVADTQKKIRVP